MERQSIEVTSHGRTEFDPLSCLSLLPSDNDSSESIKKSFYKNPSCSYLYNKLVSSSLKRLLLNIFFLLSEAENQTQHLFPSCWGCKREIRFSAVLYSCSVFSMWHTDIIRITSTKLWAAKLLQLVSPSIERETQQFLQLNFPPLNKSVCTVALNTYNVQQRCRGYPQLSVRGILILQTPRWDYTYFSVLQIWNWCICMLKYIYKSSLWYLSKYIGDYWSILSISVLQCEFSIVFKSFKGGLLPYPILGTGLPHNSLPT